MKSTAVWTSTFVGIFDISYLFACRLQTWQKKPAECKVILYSGANTIRSKLLLLFSLPSSLCDGISITALEPKLFRGGLTKCAHLCVVVKIKKGGVGGGGGGGERERKKGCLAFQLEYI